MKKLLYSILFGAILSASISLASVTTNPDITGIPSGGGVAEGSDVGFGNITATSLSVGLGSESTPAIVFGENRDTGFFSLIDGYIYVALQGVTKFRFLDYAFLSNTADGFYMPITNATATNPVYAFTSDTNTGVGWAGAEQLSLIAGGVEGMRITETGGEIVFTFDVQETKPANCSIGDFYVDTSGAYCACGATDTWSNMIGTGTCS